MIVQKVIGNKIMSYSDKGYYIKKLGKKGKYQIAYDKKPVTCRYVEIKEKIVPEELEEIEEEKTYEQELEELKRKYNKG